MFHERSRRRSKRKSRMKVASERQGRSSHNPYAQLDGEEAVALFLKRVVVLVTAQDETRFAEELLLRTGVPPAQAHLVASALAAADVRSRYAFGLLSLPDLLERLMRGYADADATPKLVTEAPALAVVEAGRALGPVAGHFCMQLALEKAARSGLGVVFCRGYNDIGLTSWFTDMAVKKNMVGLCFCTLHEMTPDSRNTVAGNPNVAVSRLGAAVPAGEFNDLEVHMSWRLALPPQKMPARQTAELRMGNPMQLADLPLEPRPPPGACGHTPQRGFLLALIVEGLCGCLAGLKYRGLVRRKEEVKRSREPSEVGGEERKVSPPRAARPRGGSQEVNTVKNLKWARLSEQQTLEGAKSVTGSAERSKSQTPASKSLPHEYLVFSAGTASTPPPPETRRTRRLAVMEVQENGEDASPPPPQQQPSRRPATPPGAAKLRTTTAAPRRGDQPPESAGALEKPTTPSSRPAQLQVLSPATGTVPCEIIPPENRIKL